jgi:lipopolysaccharide transport system ATP-binding protein
MSSIAIEAHSISKQYDLGEGSLLKLLRRTSANEEFWALRNISFEIREGEAVGIIGSNGAGKSTLLKILSRVTAPTRGRARIRGRMGTILEVGTGFHPELTGRENIFLSGTILGMRKSEIDRKFDEIVDFAGVDQFIDTPVKRYSSGMYVRLAFAVAAHLDPDILIVDEVLAVGDVGFQKKCLAKMDSSIQQEGRTIIFVSHNMQAIRSLCTRAMLLDRGSLVADGAVADVLSEHAAGQRATVDLRNSSLRDRLNRTRGHARISAVSLGRPKQPDRSNWTYRTGDAVEFRISYEVLKPLDSLEFVVTIAVAGTGEIVTSIRDFVRDGASQPGDAGDIVISVPKLPLRAGEFALTLGLGSNDFANFEDILDANVSLPHLIVEATDGSMFGRGGLIAIDYNLSRTETDRTSALVEP